MAICFSQVYTRLYQPIVSRYAHCTRRRRRISIGYCTDDTSDTIGRFHRSLLSHRELGNWGPRGSHYHYHYLLPPE